jgi:toxin ParE1/3/4
LTLRITRPAQADIDNAFDYLSKESPRGADLIIGRIASAIATLDRAPYTGRPGRTTGTRELVIPRTSYIAIYEVTEIGVTILRVMHGRQQWPSI